MAQLLGRCYFIFKLEDGGCFPSMCQHFPVLNDRKAVLTKLLAKRKGWECWAATSRANVWSFPWLRCQGCCLFLGGLGPLLKWQRALCIVALEVTVSPWARQLSLCFVCVWGGPASWRPQEPAWQATSQDGRDPPCHWGRDWKEESP